MAGAILAPGLTLVQPSGEDEFKGEFLIKNAEVVNEGDLVALDSNGLVVVASKTQSAVVQAWGVAFFPGNNGTNNVRTGDGTTIKCSIARKAVILGATSTMVPSLGKGKRVFLGPVDTTSVSNYTCALTTTNGDAIQFVGYVMDDGVTMEIFDVSNGFQYQTAGNSTVNFA